jgi:hypothetical protein
MAFRHCSERWSQRQSGDHQFFHVVILPRQGDRLAGGLFSAFLCPDLLPLGFDFEGKEIRLLIPPFGARPMNQRGFHSIGNGPIPICSINKN